MTGLSPHAKGMWETSVYCLFWVRFMAEAQAQVIIRTVADLRAHAITTWLQPITVCIPIPEGDALKVNLESQGSLPVS